ncbi:glutathione-disulfide reductase [Rhizomicrobium electricum]|uniref:Glutathione-disulfide reductase n=1 Tax=Rhizomicrobium electricum TaxID=480070 RepID=A0ABP3PJC9_9PROT|nr:glutathione-disulfide reductase [Rhizomicrobium electricum]NIJ47088.1 glutathione reductase (NADPH) [Rhizomicrobium electricum]
MAKYDFDLFVIGGGSGGVRAARMTAGLGLKVGLAEASRMGGTCVIRGCVPKKLYVYASRFTEDFALAPSFGWSFSKKHFDWATLQANKNAEIARLEGLYTKGVEGAGATIYHQHASFEDAHTIRLADGHTVTADKVLIATGSHSARDLFGAGGVEHCCTSDEVFDWKQLPASVMIAGGGYIAVEFAHIFHMLGVETTLVVRRPKVLRGFDEDLRDALMASMERRGLKVLPERQFTAVEREGNEIHAVLTTGERIVADRLLLAWGRIPNTKGLGLERIGIVPGKNGRIEVDAYSRTAVDNIYAVGDVTDRLQLTPVAIHEAMCFVKTVFQDTPTRPDHAMVPTGVFTTPEIGTVGMSEETALSHGHAVDVYKSTFRPMRFALAGEGDRMMMKLIVDQKTERVLGCHLFGPDASEMVQIVAVAMKMGATKAQFDATIALHPSAAEELVTMRTKSYSKTP